MKSALLSKIAMCVCPPAVVATSAVTVPPVRRAVHRLTAPAAAPVRAKPHRVFSAAYDCTPTAVPLSNAPAVGMTAVAPTDVTGAPPTALSAVPATAGVPGGFTPFGGGPYVGPLYSITSNTNPNPTPPAVLPEASTWAMSITGFGAVGWAMRRRPRAAEAGAEPA